MSRKLLLLVLTLAFEFNSRAFGVVYNDEDLKSDYLTLKWHPNKIYLKIFKS